MMAHLEGRKLTGRIVQRKNINVERDVVCGTMQDQNMARWMYFDPKPCGRGCRHAVSV